MQNLVKCDLKSKRVTWWLSVAFIFSCFFWVECLTPMHSDDFSYTQLGLSFSSHLRHYMGWSGRVLADYAASLILRIHNHFIVSAIIAGIATALCFFISAIPSVILDGISKKSPWKFLCISVLYWISNPNLGQTTFWVVGACNYLVTTFFIAFFLYVFALHIKDKEIGAVQTFSIFILSVIAGCTNENMGLTLVYMLCTLFAFYQKTGKSINNKLFLYAVVGLLIGSAVLLLAPGNYVRLSHDCFSEWREKTIFYKMIFHLLIGAYSLFESLKESLIFYAVMLAASVYYLKQAKNKILRFSVYFSAFCFSAFVFSFLVMVAAPHTPPRAFNGMFFFLLLATSFLLNVSLFKEKLIKNVSFVFLFIGIYLFFLSFSMIVCSYKMASTQADIRNSHVNYERLKHGKDISVTIPNYYIVNLRKDRDMFDTYHSLQQASYFGVNEIKVKDVSYDYSALKTGRKLSIINETNLRSAQIYIKPSSLLCKYGTLLMECSEIPDKKVHLQYYIPRSDILNDVELKDCIELQGKYYLGATVKNLEDINCARIVYANG